MRISLPPCRARIVMMFYARTCGLLLWLAALVSAQSAGHSLVVEVSPVVHTAAPFSVEVTLPPSFALKKGGVQAEVCIVNQEGEETLLLKRKLRLAAGGEAMLQHELEGLLIGCEGSQFKFCLEYFSMFALQ